MPDTSKRTNWKERIDSAERYYRKWATKFMCSKLERYYRGFHWVANESETQPAGYTLNMVMTTLEIKLASYSFQNLQFKLKPRPNKSDFNLEFAIQSAQVKEDCLNTIVGNPNGMFCDEIEAALKDSFFRFGILEVGYAAEWILNPNAGKPLYKSDIDPSYQTDEPVVVKEPEMVPQNELVYFKHIPALRFRVGGIEGRYLERSNWFGYYDFYDVNDIKSSKILKNTDDLTTISHRTDDFDEFASEEFNELCKKGDLLKVWKLWDTRAKTVNLYDPTNDVILYSAPYKRCPIFDLRWIRDTLGWYPIPPVFNWISPQDELNESRQQLRSYRRRFTAQNYAVEGQIDQDELDKYEEAKDGAVIKIKREGAIGAIPNSPLSQVVPEAMVVGKDDFVLVSGTSSESMGQADRITATQSIEIAKRFGVRESREQVKVANWIVKVGREALLLAQDKFITGLWIKSSQNTGESIMGAVQVNNQVWQYMMSQDLEDGIDFDVDVQLTSMSPLDNDAEKQKFIEFVAMLSKFPQIALSPKMIREAAYRIGYRNEEIIRELQATALLSTMGQMAGALPQGDGARTAQMRVDQMVPPNMAETQSQLDGQLNGAPQ